MAFIPGGTFRMGSNRHYPEEAPEHPVTVDDFYIDISPVTNAQFEAFIDATGYVTAAERPLALAEYPGVPAQLLQAGSLVFMPPSRVVTLHDWGQWWRLVFAANWRHPQGPKSSLKGLEQHPVVHIAYRDALAYASWAGKDLPTEAEWEFAARGGLDGAEYAWGDELMPQGAPMANLWQGEFPIENTRLDGFLRTSPVGSFPPNGFGLLDMIGNVWEWTADYYGAYQPAGNANCIERNPRNERRVESCDPDQPDIRIPRRVLKGGSHLCAPNYCRRYRPAARHAQPEDSSTSHIGFRCVLRLGP